MRSAYAAVIQILVRGAVTEAERRLRAYAAEWNVEVSGRRETYSSLIGFGRIGDQPVILKIVRKPGDEWESGRTVAAFAGVGMVRVLAHVPGAQLLERLVPGYSLADSFDSIGDDRALGILGRLASTWQVDAPPGTRTVEEYGASFQRYHAASLGPVPERLVERAREMFSDLTRTQKSVRLLHGDLQHYNVLFDDSRGWTAIDPKGIAGELEFEIGPILRNPPAPESNLSRIDQIERRVGALERVVHFDRDRVIRWSFALAVLSCLWSIEDHRFVSPADPALHLAKALSPVVE